MLLAYNITLVSTFKVLHYAEKCSRRILSMSSKNRLTINLSEGEHAAIADIADRCHVSAAWIGRQALREFLEKYRHSSIGLPLPFPVPAAEEKHSVKVGI